MSYILEALRRAESERERKRGGVPGLHAQPVPMPSLDDARARRTPWGWITTGVSAAVLLLILWRWWSAEPLVDEAALARAPVGGNVSQGNADPRAAPTPAPPPVETPPPAAPPPAAAAPPPAPAPAPRAKSPPAAREKAPRTTKPATPPRSSATAAAPRRDADDKAAAAPTAQPPQPNAAAPTGANAAPRTATPTAPPAPPPVPERLPKLAELPDDLRSSVPQLAFGGSVYSDTPAQRMVILNNQVMREGDAVTNEVQIEQIRPRSAVLRVRGQRFEMVF
jgi:general secretion pathway protein B